MSNTAGGNVMLGGSGLTGVTIAAVNGGTTVDATSSGGGSFTLPGLTSGEWVLTASKTGYIFSDPQTVTVAGANITGLVFEATAVSAVAGLVEAEGVPLAGASVQAADFSTTTGEDGTFSLPLPDGEYVLVCSAAGYAFAPAYVVISVVGYAISGQNFAGMWLGATAQDPVGVFQGIRIALEESFGVLPENPVWIDIPAESFPVTENQGLIDSKALRFSRIAGVRAAAGVWKGSGTMKVELDPDSFATLLYAAFGAVDSVLHEGSTVAYDHTYQFGNAQKSFTVDAAQRDALGNALPAKRWTRYTGCTIDKLTLPLALGAYVTADLSISPQQPLILEFAYAPAYSARKPLLAVKGSFQLPVGEDFDAGEKADVEIDFKTLHAGAIGYRYNTRTGVGQPSAALTITPYLHGQAEAEVSRFMGDPAFDFSDGAIQSLAGAVLNGANLKLVMESEEFADTGVPYALAATGQNLVIAEHDGIVKGGDKLMDVQLKYQALYDPATDTLFNLVLTNTMTNAQITCGL
jgi:hypothetical protein